MRTIWLALAALGLAATPVVAAEGVAGTGVTVPEPVPVTVPDALSPDVATVEVPRPDVRVSEPRVVVDVPEIDLDASLPVDGSPAPAGSTGVSPSGDGGAGAASTPAPVPPEAGDFSRVEAPSAGASSGATVATDSPSAIPAGEPHRRPFGTVVVAAARPFALPLGLAIALLVFAATHGWNDRRDPRLAHAPVDDRDEHLKFP